MPTPTTRNGFRKPDVGADTNTWGANLNSAVFDLVDASLDGWTEISSSGTTTLTSNQYVSNQARQRCLHYSASSSGTLIIPPVEKNYIVWAENADVTISTSGPVTATIKAGDKAIVICDGSDCHKVQSNDFDGDEIVNIATPTTNNSAVTKAYVDGIAFETTGALPGQNVGTTYEAVFSDGSNASWRRTHPQSTSSNTGRVLKSTGVDGFPDTTSLQWDWDAYQGLQSKSADYTIALTDRGSTLLCSNTITISVTAAATLGSKFYCRVINAGSGLVTIDPNGSETITIPGLSSKTTIILIPGEGVDLMCDGSNFTALLLKNANEGPHLIAYEQTNPSYANASWANRIISTLDTNKLGVSYSAGAITGVPAGTYRARFTAGAALAGNFVARLYDNTASSQLILGVVNQAVAYNPSTGDANQAFGEGLFTLSTTSSISLQTQGGNTTADGASYAVGTISPFNNGAALWLTRISP